MVRNDSTVDKTGGSSIDKSGTVVVAIPGHGGLRLDAEHVIDPNRDGRKQLIYLGSKSEGIDFIVTERTVTARSERAQDHLDAHTRTDTRDDEDDGEDPHADDEPRLVTDGGRDCLVSVDGTPVREDEVIKHLNILRDDVVEIEEPIFKVTECHPRDVDRPLICVGHKGVVDPGYFDPLALHRCADCDVLMAFDTAWCIECTRSRRESSPFFDDEDDEDDDEPTLVTDGGRDIGRGESVEYDGRTWRVCTVSDGEVMMFEVENGTTIAGTETVAPLSDVEPVNLPCTECGADLTDAAEMETVIVGPRDANVPQPVEVPDARCGECGASVGAKLGQRAVHALVDVLGDPRDEDDEDGSERSLVADGGSRITSGDVVRFDGREWRVARTSRSHVELYRGDEPPKVVPLSDARRVPCRDDVHAPTADDEPTIVTDGGWDRYRGDQPEPAELEADWRKRWGDKPFDVQGFPLPGTYAVDLNGDEPRFGRVRDGTDLLWSPPGESPPYVIEFDDDEDDEYSELSRNVGVCEAGVVFDVGDRLDDVDECPLCAGRYLGTGLDAYTAAATSGGEE